MLGENSKQLTLSKCGLWYQETEVEGPRPNLPLAQPNVLLVFQIFCHMVRISKWWDIDFCDPISWFPANYPHHTCVEKKLLSDKMSFKPCYPLS